MLLGCPMSQPPRKPLFWHALFVTVCLSVVYCVLMRSVSHRQQKHDRAYRKTAGFHVHKTAGMPHVPGPAQTSVLARFVCNCLSVSGLLRLGVQCVAHARKTRKRTVAQHKTAAAFHIHMKKHKEKHIRSFFLSARSRSAVAVEVGLPETGSSSGFVLAIRNRLERKSHCRQIPASHHRGCGLLA